MSFKVFIKTIIIIIIFILSLVGCSTTKTTNVACDFVGGVAHDSDERQERQNRGDMHGREVNSNNKSSSIIVGIFNVIGGMLERSLKDDTSGKCT
jgi:hypothetical protein